ncbi:MAG: MBOAT family O-acyltransferase [Pseudomonadota bacterium]
MTSFDLAGMIANLPSLPGMPFHSYWFVLGFLPAAYILFLISHRVGGWPMAIRFLGIASLVYYAQFGLSPLAVLITSVGVNYIIGMTLVRGMKSRTHAGFLLAAGVVANLLMLGYFKYSNFLIDVSNQLSGAGFSHINIMVTVGVSFFTFIQIGFLIEAYNGQVQRQPFSRYLVFATFFPCIAAGPLVMQKEMFDQMKDRSDSAFNARRLAAAVTLFCIGLFKKCAIADSIAPYADSVFNGASAGLAIDQATAWAGALAYTMQLYFDFSGYCDMALGLGLLFGLKLPLNFNSPFKATNISDFWRRWHMTMTRFFTSFIYTPLAMNGMRSALTNGWSPLSRYLMTAAVPAIVTFLIAGIWHGSGYTFIVYGLIHGVAIAAYLGWREAKMPALPAPVAWVLTMLVVVTGLVVFRADNMSTVVTMLSTMWLPMLSEPVAVAQAVEINLARVSAMIVLLLAVVLLFPNSQQILHRDWPSIDPKPDNASLEAGLLTWRPRAYHSLSMGLLFCVALSSIGASSSFLYYQF